jgi:hypothetical protein
MFPLLERSGEMAVFTVDMTNVLDRELAGPPVGSRRKKRGGATFSGAHGLAMCISLVFITIYLGAGSQLVGQLAGAQDDITAMAHLYLLILVLGTPLQFLLGLHADALPAGSSSFRTASRFSAHWAFPTSTSSPASSKAGKLASSAPE